MFKVLYQLVCVTNIVTYLFMTQLMHCCYLGEEVQPTRLSVPTSTYHLVACLLGIGSVVLVDQTTAVSYTHLTLPTNREV